MPRTIEIIDDLMCVLDEDGNGCDAAELTGYRDAKLQIGRWVCDYTFDVADAYRKLASHFASLEEAEDSVAEIARRILGIHSLKARNSDSLDFHEVGVVSLEEALLAAYRAGIAVGRKG